MLKSERLIQQLIERGLVPSGNYLVQRTYAGADQRSHGAWSWGLVYADSGVEAFVGSQWSVTELLKRGWDDDCGSLYPHNVRGDHLPTNTARG